MEIFPKDCCECAELFVPLHPNSIKIAIMIDLKNPKWEDFHISDMPKREAMPGVKVHCGIYRRKPGSPRPQYKQHSSISIPKEIFDGHLQTGVYRIG